MHKKVELFNSIAEQVCAHCLPRQTLQSVPMQLACAVPSQKVLTELAR